MTNFSPYDIQDLVNNRDLTRFTNVVLGMPTHAGQEYWFKESTRSINILKPANQWGKGLWEEELVLTTVGFKKAKDIKQLDILFSVDGKTTKIKGIFPQGKKKTYKMIFRDGVSVIVDGDHLWQKVGRFGRKEETLSTDEYIRRFGFNPKPFSRLELPQLKPISFTKKTLPIDPYTLGLLLGDGGITCSVRFTTADVCLLESFDYHKIKNTKYEYSIRGLVPKLRGLGLFGRNSYTKFIPEIYLLSSVKDRLKILRGLMDTDGNIEKSGKIEYCSVSEKLKDGVVFLVQSLGGSCKVSRKKDSYRVRIKLKLNPFHLEKKASRFFITKNTYGRILERIEEAGERETICFSVEHKSKLFVINHFLVTHNTTAEACKHIFQAVCKPQLDKFGDMDIGDRLSFEYRTLNFGKTYEVAKGVMESIIDITQGHYLLPTGRYNKSMLAGWAIKRVDDTPRLPRIIWWNNSKTLIRSWDGLGESFKRLRLAFISGDECGDIPELKLFLNGTLLPRLFFFEGKVDLVGTSQPKGLEYEELAEEGQKEMEERDSDARIFVLSAVNNPDMATVYRNDFMPVESIKEIEAISDPELRKQIIYGQYVDYNKHLYTYEEVAHMFVPDLPYDLESGLTEVPQRDGTYIFSVDMAASEDETSCTCIRYGMKRVNQDGKSFPLPYRVVFHKAWKGATMPLSLQYEVIKSYYKMFWNVAPARTKFVYDAGSLGGKNAGDAFRELHGYPFPPVGRSYVQVKAEGMGKVKEVLGRYRDFGINDKSQKVDKNTNWGGVKASILLKELRRQMETSSKDDDKLKNDQYTSFMQAIHFIEARAPKQSVGKVVRSFNILV